MALTVHGADSNSQLSLEYGNVAAVTLPTSVTSVQTASVVFRRTIS